jgi:hypothetical protein
LVKIGSATKGVVSSGEDRDFFKFKAGQALKTRIICERRRRAASMQVSLCMTAWRARLAKTLSVLRLGLQLSLDYGTVHPRGRHQPWNPNFIANVNPLEINPVCSNNSNGLK